MDGFCRIIASRQWRRATLSFAWKGLEQKADKMRTEPH
jgi:hypothetical protein